MNRFIPDQTDTLILASWDLLTLHLRGVIKPDRAVIGAAVAVLSENGLCTPYAAGHGY